MASSAGPLTSTGNGYTIVTQVFSPSSLPSTTEQSSTPDPLAKFLKGEPKALGTIQIIIGLLSFLTGIALAATNPSIVTFSGVFAWGSLFYIISGSLTVGASNKRDLCLIKGALAMNVFSAIGAGIFIIMLSLDITFDIPYYRYARNTRGVNGVLLVFNILEFAISIANSAFACKVGCRSEPMVNVITLLPNAEAGCPERNPLPASYCPQGAFVNTVPGAFVSTVPGALVSTVPGAMGPNTGLVNTGPGAVAQMENPPPYSECKVPPHV